MLCIFIASLLLLAFIASLLLLAFIASLLLLASLLFPNPEETGDAVTAATRALR